MRIDVRKKWMAAVGLSLLIAGAAAQTYPVKPMRILTGGAGGGSDFTARLVAQGLTLVLGQQVIVDNRASGIIPGATVAKAPPDGYTLLVISGTLWLSPFLQNNVPFDAIRDFAPISMVNRAPNILVVHPSIAANTVKDLIALAKSTAGGLSYSSGSTGASSHLAGELFKAMAGVNLVRIPYKSGATEIADLIGGQVKLSFGTAASVTPHIKSGKLRALAVTSLQSSALAPGLPTVAASGLPGYDSGTVTGLLAPARTSPAIIERLHREVVQFINTPQTQERLLSAGVEAVAGTPREFTDYIKADIVKWGKVIKDAGIVAE